MGSINISNSKNRDAMVKTESVRSPLRVRWLDEKSRQTHSVRILRATVDRDADSLVQQAGGLEKVADTLVKGDPEIDMETYGSFLSETTRVYINPDKKIVHKITEFEIVKNPDGSVRERRPRKVQLPNTSTEVPLKWSGKLMKKSEVFNKFVFAAKLQIAHVNGLTFDFLYDMARELEAQKSLMLVGAGPKGNLPLVLQRGGTPYRGFLEGRTQGDKYCLILHLSNMELKAPEPLPTPAAPPAEAKAEPDPEVKTEPKAEPKATKAAPQSEEAEAKPRKKAAPKKKS